MKKIFLSIITALPLALLAAPSSITPFIRIDQFGYLCNSRKVAVIADPQTGYNSADAYSPGTAANQYQVRRWSDDAIVFAGTITAWNGGATHTQSGDKGWWFDFSSLTQPGSYYIYDLATLKGSYRFEIGANVYTEALKQSCRMFYYQRCNFAKTTPYADARWTDVAAFEGARQDRHARSRYDKNNAATEKDVSGGWFDAGDLNKYTTFAVLPLTQMMEAYRLHPSVFTENLNLPETGNGIPDILDEVKWEIDWLKKMQDATGTNGLMLKVGADNYNLYTPPGTDINHRYYVPECTSATLSGAVVFALAANIYKSLGIPTMTTYGNDLQIRAINAFARAQTTTSNFTSYQTSCDDQDIKSGDADQGAGWQKLCAVAAAVYLYEATGSATYKNFVENNYSSIEPISTYWWGPYNTFIQRALLCYTQISGVDATVVSTIRDRKANTNTGMSIPQYINGTDLYRAYMPDAQYHWGSNQVKGGCGSNALDYVQYNISTTYSNDQYKELAEQYLHWLHGVNPEGIVMLSNMYAYGGDSCVNEIYHSWFYDGTIYDNAKTSSRGPAPGYITGGPNKDFSVGSLTPPSNQPPQKAYKDWNTAWDGSIQQSSYKITEPAIYYQAMYIQLLAAIIDYGSTNCSAVILPIEPTRLKATVQLQKAVLQWEGNSRMKYELQRSADGHRFTGMATFNNPVPGNTFTYADENLAAGRYWYRLLILSVDGDKGYSNTTIATIGGKPGLFIKSDLQSGAVYLQSTIATKATVKIFATDSRLVRSANLSVAAGETIQLDTHGLPHGNYLTEVIANEIRVVEKVVL